MGTPRHLSLRVPLTALLLCMLQATSVAGQWQCTSASGDRFTAASNVAHIYSGLQCLPVPSTAPNSEPEELLPEPVVVPLSPPRLRPTAADSKPKKTAPQRCQRVEKLLTKIATQQELDPLLLHAIIQRTSLYQSDYLAPGGAMGLVSVVPELSHHFGVVNERTLNDTKTNLTVATQHLAALQLALQGDLVPILHNYYAGTTLPNLLAKDAPIDPAAKQFVHEVLTRYLAMYQRKAFGMRTESSSACDWTALPPAEH